MSNRKKTSEKHIHQIWPAISYPSALTLGVPAGIVLIIVSVLIAYLPATSGVFVLDDNLLLTENKLIEAPDGLYRFWFTTETIDYWPVTNTTFWIEWRLWEMNSTAYHVTNLILHIVEVLLIWVILRKLSIPGAFLAAMLFALYPVNVESVAWIAQRKNLMAILFFLLSILWNLKIEIPSPLAPRLSSLWYWLSLAAFVLAMLSKGSVVVLPLLLLVIICWLRPIALMDFARISPFFVVAVALASVNVWFQTHGTETVYRNAGFTERLLGAGGVVWFYLYKALLPIDLAFVYPQWRIQTGNLLWWLPLVAAFILTAVLWWYRKGWGRPILFAWGFFCAALVPAMGFADIAFMKYALVADHYQHIALIGAVALMAAGWGTWHRRAGGKVRWAVIALAIVATGTFGFLTWQQSGLYRDAITLYQTVLKINPDFWIAHYNLGNALVIAGRPHKAIDHYKQALRLEPNDPLIHNNLGVAFFHADQTQAAIEQYEQALRLKPNYPEAYNNLGDIFTKLGQYQQAIEYYKNALQLNPDFIEVHIKLGAAFVKTGQPQEAIYHYKQVLRLKPDLPEAHNNLGNALIQAGLLKEAIEHCEQALRLKPDYPEARYNLGNALFQTSRPREAIEQYQQALRGKPDYPEAHNNLGLALNQTHRPDDAIEQFKQALRLRPDYINACNNLALTYAGMHRSTEAIEAAQKALESAKSQGQTAMVKQIEDWLNTYQKTGDIGQGTENKE